MWGGGDSKIVSPPLAAASKKKLVFCFEAQPYVSENKIKTQLGCHQCPSGGF